MAVDSCSVVIPTYNRADLLRRTLESLTRQSLPRASFEVLVADDGSTDHTAEVARSFGDRLNLTYLFQPDEGWRVAHARNLGIAHATGDVCVMVDTGVVLHSGNLAAHLDSQQDGPAAVLGLVYGFGTDSADEPEMNRTLDLTDPDASIELLRRTGRWPDIRDVLYARHQDDLSGLPAPWIVFWTCNVSAPLDRIKALGGFDEHYRSWGGEDIDLGYRLYLDGVRFVVNRSASSIHYPHGSNMMQNMEQAKPNHRYMAAKFGTPVAGLLPSLGGALNYYTFNDVIRMRRLPACADYLRDRQAG